MITTLQLIYVKERRIINFRKMPVSKQKIKEESAVVLKEATPAGGGFAGFFSLQAGTVLTSTCIFRNIFWFTPTFPWCSSGLASCQPLLLRNPKWLLVGSIFVTCSSIYWFTMSLLSFFPSLAIFKYLCIMDRCPPTHWIFEVPWRNASEQGQDTDDVTSPTPYTSDGTPTNDSRDDTSPTTATLTTIDVTSPIDLNSGVTHPPNSTGTLVGDCDRLPTISNGFLYKELHDLKVIESMKKRDPTNMEDDEGDGDTRQDNALYDLQDPMETHQNKSFRRSLHRPFKGRMNKRVTATTEAESCNESTSMTTSTTEPANNITSEATTPEANTTENTTKEAFEIKIRNRTTSETSTIKTINMSKAEAFKITDRPTAETVEITDRPTAETFEKTERPTAETFEVTDRPTSETSGIKTTIGPTAEPPEIKTTNRPTAETFETTDRPTAEPSETEITADDLSNDNDDDNVYMMPSDNYPQPTDTPEEIQNKRDKQWVVNKFMSSVELIYSKDMFGGNLAMSIISFVLFSVFLVYGIVCMFHLYKRLKRRQREREIEDEDEDEATIDSRTSLRTHPSRKSQRSQ